MNMPMPDRHGDCVERDPGGAVITGIGMIGALGPNRARVWQRVLAGTPQMGTITAFDAAAYGVEHCVVAQIKSEELSTRLAELAQLGFAVPRKGRFRQLTLIAACEAMADAGMESADDVERFAAGIVLGTNSAGTHEIERIAAATLAGRKPRVSDNMSKRTSVAIQDVARAFDLGGPMFGVDAACASGAAALIQACRLVSTGGVPWCLAGGVDVPIVASNIKLASVLGVVATGFAHDPKRASRPFDRRRDGYVPAEGACMLMVENRHHAAARGARCYAEVVGFAQHTDHVHPTRLSAKFVEAVMRQALRHAGLSVSELGWISAHATSTIQGDAAEAAAIGRVLDGHDVLCSAVKSVTGHLLGASGTYEAAIAAMSLDEQVIPPTINLDDQDPACPIHCPTQATGAKFEHVMCNAFGFGGAGCSIILRRPNTGSV